LQAGGHRFEPDRLQGLVFDLRVEPIGFRAEWVALPENLLGWLLGWLRLSVLFGMVNRDLVCKAFGALPALAGKMPGGRSDCVLGDASVRLDAWDRRCL
jgi:hypothetical protein